MLTTVYMGAADLSHHSYRSFPFGLGDSVLDEVIHVLIIKQANQVKGAKTSSTAQGQVSNNH